jgi:4'-phosphopantetheinyl transferase
MTQIVESFFSPLELRVISAVPDAKRNMAFFRCWTRKEAIIKTSGEGLGRPLDGFDVSAEATSQVVAVHGDEGEQERFFLYDLGLSDGYIGAVACRRSCDRISLFQYGS